MTDISVSESTSILRENYNGHLAYIADGKPYVIPITYFFDAGDNSIISYTAEGHKINAMRKNNDVSVVVEQIQSMVNWESALVHGTFEELEGSTAKEKLHQFTEGIKAIIRRKENKNIEFINEFSSKSYSRGTPIVYKINIEKVTGKRREI
ncbi:pyridoxamine 5'-phosphate oxidase family protein [Maribacter sp. BPC-D8]|uniref:pyridoxamine 5'-phosphate oxidase family protein n=1 Tax=Maribacter sp. BPC-D8 TaxID=3053613 RepID=UPI002B47118A|nr:pyridoxamine 5'-phosphate oxidase family protein [Maribacter sp. BPC-D8]WRI31442.1 pyridoxamine 5'-phosphate oxidase family protein [Maribacter sp. BPC-D8]